MTEMPKTYMPCLRWKQGEYQAVMRSTEEVLERLVPLIEVPEIGYDFEKRTSAKSIDEHLVPFAKRVAKKLGPKPCYVDLLHIEPNERLKDGNHPARYIFDCLREEGIPAVPVFHLRQDEALFRALSAAAKKDGRGACLRLSLEEAAIAALGAQLRDLLGRLDHTPGQCDLVLDLGSPNFLPVDGLVGLIRQMLAVLPHLNEWRTFTLLGTSFPATTAEIHRGISVLPRYEWRLYGALAHRLRDAGLRLPRFGDYCIAHPALVHMDMRFVKPNATVRYTISEGWLVAKGKNVRDNGFEQFRELCRMVVSSSDFDGSEFSLGDKYIEDCALGVASTGRLTTWRWVGTNRHLAKVVRDISSLSETSSFA